MTRIARIGAVEVLDVFGPRAIGVALPSPGLVLVDLLHAHRLEHARLALEHDAVSLKQVSFRVGYNHVSNFVSAFRTRYGVPPRQHREQRAEPALRS